MSGSTYRAEIDGLRAFAVIPVILFHLGVSWMPGGYAGVDVFFVISGFLITRLILVEIDEDRFNLTDFWLRRIRRLLPALLVVIATTLIAAYFCFYSIEVNSIGRQSLAAMFSVANSFYWMRAGNYWGQAAEESVLLHTWTLSLEEQFYIVYPFLLTVLAKGKRAFLGVGVAAIVLISLLSFVMYSQANSTAAFYLLPFRAWELGSGSLLAVILHRARVGAETQMDEGGVLGPRFKTIASTIGLATVVASCVLMTSETGMAGGLIFPVLGTVAVIAFTGKNGKGQNADGQTSDQGINGVPTRNVVCSLLSAKPIVYVGRLSYSLYLWHWPVIVFLRKLSPNPESPMVALIAIVLTFWLGIASFHLIEQTTRRRKSTAKLVAVGFAACALLAWSMVRYQVDVSGYSPTVWQGRLYNVAPNEEFNWDIAQLWRGIDVPEPKSRDGEAFANGGVIRQYGDSTPEVVVMGDSHALMWSGVIDEICLSNQLTVSFYAADGTDPFFEIPVEMGTGGPFMDAQQEYQFNVRRMELLKEWRPKIVIITVRWKVLNSFEAADDLLSYLDQIGARVLLLEQPPEIFDRSKNAPQYFAFEGMLPIESAKQYVASPDPALQNAIRRETKKLAARFDHCDFIPMADIYWDEDRVWVIDGTDVLYIDSNHLSYQGARRGKDKLQDVILGSFRDRASGEIRSIP